MRSRRFIFPLPVMTILVLSGTVFAQEAPDVDWPNVLTTADPHLTTQGPCPAMPGETRPCVFVNTTDQAWLTRIFQLPDNTPSADGKPSFMGWAMMNEITYGDIAGDGETDAVIEVDSGGTAGIAGFFVYRLTDSTPKLLGGRGGFALQAYIDPKAHALYLLGTPPPAPFRPRNPLAGVFRTTYALVADELVEQGTCTYIPTPDDVHVPQSECSPL